MVCVEVCCWFKGEKNESPLLTSSYKLCNMNKIFFVFFIFFPP